MKLSKADEAEVRRLHFAEHWPVGTIVSQRGFHAESVRRVLGLLEPRPLVTPRPRLLDPYAEFIEQTLRSYPTLRATRLFDMLQPRGYPGSVRTLREYVAEVRPRPNREAFLRTEPLLGEQAQVDWAMVGKLAVPGGERPLWAFVMVLSHSRAMWAELVFDLTVPSLCRSLVRASRFFGGCTRQWLFDNPKTIVLERAFGAERFQPALLELAGRFCVQPRLCAVRQPQQKGRVERAVRYLRDRFFAGRVLSSIEQGNADLLRFFEEVAHPRPHPVQAGRTVAECFAEERERLLALPDPLPETDQVLPVTPDKTAFVRFDTNDYSVPTRVVEEDLPLTLCADDRTVRFLVNQEEVARHERCWGKRQRLELREHRAELLSRRRAALPDKGLARLQRQVPAVEALAEAWVAAGFNVGSQVSRTLALLDLYGADLLRTAVAEALRRKVCDVGALAQLCEQRRRSRRAPMPTLVKLGEHVPDRDVTPHSLEDYDE